MNQGRAVFSQLISFLPDREFRRCVERYQGDSRLRGFSCWDQYLSMAFAQLTYHSQVGQEESNRLGAHRGVSRTLMPHKTFLEANCRNDCRQFGKNRDV
jgi:hypothetical protein